MDRETKKKLDKEMKRLEKRPLNEIRARFVEVTDEQNRSPNKTFLLRRIREALERAGEHAEKTPTAEKTPSTKQPNRGDGLTKMTVEELQVKYLEVVGRASESDDKPYLIWKIRMARGGKVRVGPAREREAVDVQNVPFTLPRETVMQLDAARARLGFKTRQAFFYAAVHDLFDARGEREIAQLFKARP